MAGNDVVREEKKDEEKGGSKKVLIFAVIGIVLAAGITIAVVLSKEDDVSKTDKVEDVVDYTKMGKILLVKIGEIEAPMRRAAPGSPRRKRIVIDPRLQLKPIMNHELEKPDDSKNNAMVKRFEMATPIIRDLCIEIVLGEDPNKDLDQGGLADKIMKRINGYDDNLDPSQQPIFGKDRVQRVFFNKFEPR